MSDQDFIRQTFALARLGLGTTWPNPIVGCVIVKNGKIIGSGHHRKKGLGHAEIEALNNCEESPEGATVYVNLEPCCHINKTTPPCAQRLIQEKVRKVVIANLDPNPSVNGKGVELLRSHGIEVTNGILSDEGERVNEVFFLSQRTKRPFIHFKTATTLDGKIATSNGESQWITGEEARAHVHTLRSQHQGIMTGGETARLDNPKLNVRLPDYKGEQPYRIVFSQSGNLPAHLKLFSDEQKEKTLVYSSIEEGLEDLFKRKMICLLLEAGSGLATEFLKMGLIDRVSQYINPSFLGSGKSFLGDLNLTHLNSRPKLKSLESKWLGEDLYLTGRLMKE